MTHVSQHLHEAFPDHEALLRRLKADDLPFQELAQRFETLDNEIHQANAGDDPASDERTEAMKKQRLALLDEIAAYLASVPPESSTHDKA